VKLYAFQPKGHGQKSFFVMAEDKEKAISCIEEYIKRRIIPLTEEEWLNNNPPSFDDYDVSGCGTSYYEMTELSLGEVIENDND
jgi:hypothetical protein